MWTYHPDKHELWLTLKVTPNAKRSGFVVSKHDESALGLQVRSIAEQGKANVEALAIVSKALGVPKRCVRLVQGSTHRHKVIAIYGDWLVLERKLQALMDELQKTP